MSGRIERPEVRAGYDRWAETYDRTASSLIALDRRHTLRYLRPQSGERILDAGCGTGAHLSALRRIGARPVGLDFSSGMLRVARRQAPNVPLVQADLNGKWPLARGVFDAVLCTLVSEHVTDLSTFFSEAQAVLERRGRLVFAAFHPEMAAAGVEANFEQDGVEYRLGAEQHTVSDYRNGIRAAGFREQGCQEYGVDQTLLEELPSAEKYQGRPLLLIIAAERSTHR